MVYDFVPGEDSAPLLHLPSTATGGKLFFFLNLPGSSIALWRSDGTEVGTIQLTSEDVRPMADTLVALGDQVFFVADDGFHGFELWMSDGSVEGTAMVTDLEPGPEGSSPEWLTAAQGLLFFSAKLGVDRELWKSDGTHDGTALVKDINPIYQSYPRLLTAHRDRLFFFADDGEHGPELWSSDGTGPGTALVVELAPFGSSSAEALLSVGDRLFLSGGNTEAGFGLWVSDGTAAGTRRISPVSVTGRFKPAVFRGALVFSVWNPSQGRTEIWKSDGTEAGTVQLLGGPQGPLVGDPTGLVVFGDRLFFTTWQGVDALWESDGTPDGTRFVRAATGSFSLSTGRRRVAPLLPEPRPGYRSRALGDRTRVAVPHRDSLCSQSEIRGSEF